MRMLTAIALVIGSVGIANASTVVIGTDSFNRAARYWTYNYTIDNTKGTAPVVGLGIVILNAASYFFTTTPQGWEAATVCCIPATKLSLEWFTLAPQGGVPVGSSLSGLSFSIFQAPDPSPADNYYVVSTDGAEQFGNVAGPISTTPLPAALPLFGIGLAGLGWLARRRRG